MSKRDQNSAWPNRLAGDLLAESLRWTDAVILYRQALRLDPTQPELHASLGKTYFKQEKVQAAEEGFQNALRLDPQNESALLGLAEVQLAHSNRPSSLEILNKIWKIFPPFLAQEADFPSTRLGSARAQSLATSIEALPDSPARSYLLSRLYNAAGDEQKAPAHEAAF